jgi:hypothetical protein
MKRPELNEICLQEAIKRTFYAPTITITMSQGQWDGLLAASYDIGAVLLELDDHEVPVRAYQRKISA